MRVETRGRDLKKLKVLCCIVALCFGSCKVSSDCIKADPSCNAAAAGLFYFPFVHNNAGILQWTRLLGVAGVGTEARAVTTDSASNVYASGFTDGNLGGQIRTGTRDLFVVKYDVTGNRQWTRLLGVAAAQTSSYSITTDVPGNLFVVGSTTGALDGQSLTGTQDMFLTRYDLNGARIWTRLLGVAGVGTDARAVTTDAAGNIYVTGFTDGNLDGQTKTGNRDLFLTKYNLSGVRMWTRLLGVAPVDTWGFGIRADRFGNIFLTGGTAGNLDGQVKTGTYDVHLIKYDASGNRQWTRLLGVAGVQTEGFGLTVDQSGNAHISGYTDGNLGGETLTGTRDLFLAKYDSSGVRISTRLLGATAAATWGLAVTLDVLGNVYTTGGTTGNLAQQTKTGTWDMHVTKYNGNGTRQWTRLLGAPAVATEGFGTEIMADGTLYSVGYTEGDLGGETHTGTRDLFVNQYR